MSIIKVLITTSGIGSRLGDLTKYTNKCLIKVGDKPVISHIIESYPVDTSFVITLGHFGSHVEQYLTLVYPEHKFEFVQVDKYQGEGSSLLYSIYQAREKLLCPFIFHASDTIITDYNYCLRGRETIDDPNWCVGYKSKESSQYTSFDVQTDTIKKFYDKGQVNPDFLYLGVCRIENFIPFWQQAHNLLHDYPNDSSLNDVSVLQILLNRGAKLNILEVKKWHDTGNIDSLNKTRESFKDRYDILEKNDEAIFFTEKGVVKFFADSTICKNRVERAEKYIKTVTPTIIDFSDNFYLYEYENGKLFSKTANRNNFKDFLDWSNENLWIPLNDTGTYYMKSLCSSFYINKTSRRVEELLQSRNLKDKELVINGEIIKSFNKLFKNTEVVEILTNQCVPVKFHGDFILDNIIQKLNNKFGLIDWRQDFAGELSVGDIYYDFAKLAHNLIINHEIVKKNLFQLEIKDEAVELNIHRLQSLVECEQILFDWIEDHGYSIKKVKVLRAVIWLNMSPLHHHPFDLFLYYYGMYNLKKELE